MNYDEFRDVLDRLDLSQAVASKLLEVTPRSVNMWATGSRSVPGPVESYFRLFETMPQTFRDAELARISKEEPMFKEGIYGIQFAGRSDWGYGTLVLENGLICGVDVAGLKYDGTYEYNKTSEMIESEIKISVPPGAEIVTGMPAQPYEWAFTVNVAFPRETDQTTISVDVPGGQVNVDIRYMRELTE